MSAWRFEFTIDSHHWLQNVPLPKRMSKEIKQVWTKKKGAADVLRLHRGTENKEYMVHFRYVVKGRRGVETVLDKGWLEFVTSNNLCLEDCIMFLLEDRDDMSYRVRIWRDEVEITVVGPSTIIENDGSISDAESMEYVPMEVLFQPPSFYFTFSKGYIVKPEMHIPLPFARAHFQGLKDKAPVELYVNSKWKATMRIKFDKNKNIISCTMKKGVQQMFVGEGVEIGEKALVELEGMDPPLLSLTFT